MKVYPYDFNPLLSASPPADIVATVKEDVYPNVQKQFGWFTGCVLGR
jgi:hypothetical protein